MDLVKKMKALATPAIGGASGLRPPVLQVKSLEQSSHKYQEQWKPPAMVEPTLIEQQIQNEDNLIDLGELVTDAFLHTITKHENGKTTFHNFLKTPSRLPQPSTQSNASVHVFNLLMVDVSGSMSLVWNEVENGWNNRVAPFLQGRTSIYTFGSSVTFRRSGKLLERGDFDAGGTDLTGALQTIITEVYLCPEKYINVFLITDGEHNITDVQPSKVIDLTGPPRNKICSVFVLGVGDDFPVQISVDLRSRLHTGSSNVPTIFWSKIKEETDGQMTDICRSMQDSNLYHVKLGTSGSVLPGMPIKDVFHLGEWVYFTCDPEKLKKISLKFMGHIGTVSLQLEEVSINVLGEIFCQWNSIIFQLHRSGKEFPKEVLEFKEWLLAAVMKIVNSSNVKSVKQRQENREIKVLEIKFKEDFKQMKDLLTKEKFENQLELADAVLYTTVLKNKYKIKSLQLKGHTDEQFVQDRETFLEVLNQNHDNLQDLSETVDDRCRVTMASTLTDLQDPDIVDMLKGSDKFTFLKSFTITGIPVLAPTRDSVSLNPWSFRVEGMLRSPYTIMSQTAMESYAEMEKDKPEYYPDPYYYDEDDDDDFIDPDTFKHTLPEDKVIQLKYDDDNTRYNAVVPVFPPAVSKAMQPFVRTRLYAMCVNFATLKNPHILDHDIHMASLAVTWVRCLFENPTIPRPEHVILRMKSIEATTALYLDLPRYANYIKVLIENPVQALMTQSQILVDNKPVKSQTIVKPVFLLYMILNYSREGNSINLKQMMSLILKEYIGRCLSKYRSSDNNGTPFCDFFAESLDDQEKRKDWVRKYISDAKKSFSGNENVLLTDYFTLEQTSKAAKKLATSELESMKKELLTNVPLRVNLSKIENLRKVSTAGDISLFTLKTFAEEIGLHRQVIDELFNDHSYFVYTAHALRYRQSCERLLNDMDDYGNSYKFVVKSVQEESSRGVIELFSKELVSFMKDAWLKAYLDVHTEVVRPMTRREIINEGQQRGVQVTDENFDQVYKNFRLTGLLSNACQTRACPYYLIPHKSYNQHANVERTKGKNIFVHSLHKVTQVLKDENISHIINETASGKYTREEKAIPKVAVDMMEPDIQILKKIYTEIARS